MNNQNTQQILNALNWRYATKVFDPGRKIPAEVWYTLERALVLSPSSYGLQPYRFLVINDPSTRAGLLPHSWNQKQVVDASHYVVFTARTQMTESDVEKLIARTADVRKIPAASLNFYRDMMLGDLVKGPRSQIALEWATRQAYIALGNLMTCAAVLGVDACPMEGFVPAEYDRVLGLENSGYASVVCCALGYRAAGDKYAGLPKVRFEIKDLVRYI
ncbi:MAG: NAD(P)H-dependent oxidoreductase [Verrucomicrobiota bacterium]|jgi:nitroreductase